MAAVATPLASSSSPSSTNTIRIPSAASSKAASGGNASVGHQGSHQTQGGSVEEGGVGEQQGSEDGCSGSSELRELIVYVEPARGSKLYRRLEAARKRAIDLFGSDVSYLYGLHSSVTGFFNATSDETDSIMMELYWAVLDLKGPLAIGNYDCGTASKDKNTSSGIRSSGSSMSVCSTTFGNEDPSPISLASLDTVSSYVSNVALDQSSKAPFASETSSSTNNDGIDDGFASSRPSESPVEVEDLLVSPDGCVLLSINSPDVIANVRESLEGTTKDAMRFKKRSHITLAKNRVGSEGQTMVAFYKKEIGYPLEASDCSDWDLVLYERTFKSDDYEVQGPHVLQEVMRIPLH